MTDFTRYLWINIESVGNLTGMLPEVTVGHFLIRFTVLKVRIGKQVFGFLVCTTQEQ